jgi:hypothetical protein
MSCICSVKLIIYHLFARIFVVSMWTLYPQPLYNWCKDSLVAGLETSICTMRTHLPSLSRPVSISSCCDSQLLVKSPGSSHRLHRLDERGHDTPRPRRSYALATTLLCLGHRPVLCGLELHDVFLCFLLVPFMPRFSLLPVSS